MKRCLVTGASGFLGHHLINSLKDVGCWVRGVSRSLPKWEESRADEFLRLDLRGLSNCLKAVDGIDYVYALASHMGGVGFTSSNNSSILTDNSLVNTNTIRACAKSSVNRYLFTSSVCVYPNYKQEQDHKPLKESDVIPADPQAGYGWEKLVHELRCLFYQSEGHLNVRIARLHNIYGPMSDYEGGKEKVVAAICRKVILAKDGGEIEVWGDGKQQRSFTYVDDAIDGIYRLMKSSYCAPLNIGSEHSVVVNDLVDLIIKISGKKLKVRHIFGPEGAKKRLYDNSLCKNKLGWFPSVCLEDGITKTYKWIEGRINDKADKVNVL